MKTFVDLTAIRHRLAPKEKLSAIEEWRRLQRHETLITHWRGVLIAFGLGLAVWMLLK